MLGKVIVAIDSFKGSLSSNEAVRCCAEAVREVCPECNVVEIPIADGGEGFAEIAARSAHFKPVQVLVAGPLGDSVTARYFLNDHGRIAVMDMAQACGLTLVPEPLRNPLFSSSFGLGEMLTDAISRGAESVIIGIGGSATNDGGMGMLCALGFRFLDAGGHELKGCGESLKDICNIDISQVPDKVSKTSIHVACDVNNNFYGEQGATMVYGPQKGATPAMIEELEAGMKNFARLISDCGHPEISYCPGGGAAGGVGGALHTLLGAELKPGIEVALELSEFDIQAHDADLIITGEGKLDSQTCHGKTAIGILHHAQALNIPCVALGGQLTDTRLLEEAGFLACLSIINKPSTLSECIDKSVTYNNLKHTTKQIIGIINHYTQS